MDYKKELEQDFIKIEDYEKEYNLNLPRRNSYIYTYIEKIKDYEYTNNIAYEMLRRNTDFKELTKQSFSTKTEEWIIKILEFGLDPNINIFPTEPDILLDYDNEDKFFYESWDSHTIKDIQDGINKLIMYYWSKDKIYTLQNKDNIYNINSYIKIDKISLSIVLQTPTNYYIPCSITKDFIKTNTIRMEQISDKIPLRILDKNFLKTLNFIDTKYKYTQLTPLYSRPKLSFPQSNIINIPINLNLKDDEIIAYISKAKNEYNEKVLTIEHPLKLIEEELEEAKKLKSESEFPQEKDKRKIAVADAFYVYDLFKILEPYFKQKTDNLRDERKEKIEEIKDKFKNLKNEKITKETIIENLKETYASKIKQFSKDEIKFIISLITNLSLHKVERYYKYMKECIDNQKYIELITGKKLLEKS
jgi:hypothetical protein